MMRNDQLLLFCNDSEKLGSSNQSTLLPPAAPAPNSYQRIFQDDGIYGTQDGRMKDNSWIRAVGNEAERRHHPYDETCILLPEKLQTPTVSSSSFRDRMSDEEGDQERVVTDALAGCLLPPSQPPAHLPGVNLCAGCGGEIVDRFYLVTVNRRWHTTCLSCHHCHQSLDLHRTCFVKDGDIYCKEDYCRLFAPKRCSRCRQMISGQEFVIRAQADDIYHVDCFVCSVCERRLVTGERFGIQKSRIFCQLHYGTTPGTGSDGPVEKVTNLNPDDGLASPSTFSLDASSSFSPSPSLQAPPLQPSDVIARGPFFNGTAGLAKGRPRKRKGAMTDSIDVFGQKFGEMGYDISDVDMLSQHQRACSFKDGCLQGGNRQKRMRTSFKHHQIRTMKAYFALNHNPDAKDLKELAQKTGLTKRVLQVWFQNARAKYRRNVLKQDNENPSAADVTYNDVIDDVNAAKTKVSSARRDRSPPDRVGLSDNSTTASPRMMEDLNTPPPGELVEVDQSTSSSTLMEMFDQNYIRAN